MVKKYECPNCGKMKSLWPVFNGRKKYYQCDSCKAQYGSVQLDKVWGRNKFKSSIEIIPLGI